MSTSFGTAKISIKNNADDRPMKVGAVARLRLEKAQGQKPARSEQRKRIILPIGNTNESDPLRLAAGFWSIQIELPWGKTVQDDFSVDEDQTTEVEVKIQNSPRSHLLWHYYSGAIKSKKHHLSTFTKDKENRIGRHAANLELKAGAASTIDTSSLRVLRKSVRNIQINNRNLGESKDNADEFFGSSALELPYDDIAKIVKEAPGGSSEEKAKVTFFRRSESAWQSFANDRHSNGKTTMSGIELVKEETVAFSDIYEVFKFSGPGRPDGGRIWAHVSAFGENRLISIPSPWPHKYMSKEDSEFEILIRLLESESGFAQLLLKDSDTAAMLAYMTNDRLFEASIIVKEAESWLFRKMSNPLAAVGGGYVMLATKLHSEDTHWTQWISNLAKRFPDIPDGKILEGYLYLNGPRGIRDHKKAAQCYYEAYQRGVPFYSLGLAWMEAGVALLEYESPELKNISRTIRLVSRMLETKHTFTTLRLAPTE